MLAEASNLTKSPAVMDIREISNSECVAMHSNEALADGHDALRRLFAAIFICFAFMVVELVGGLLAGSLAIMTDAAHLLIDLTGFLISLVAIGLSKKVAKTSMSWGYRRAEILGALFSLFLVWALTFYLVIEACARISTPVPINGRIMFNVSLLGVFGNILMLVALHKGHKHGTEGQAPTTSNDNINIRAALVHALGDLIQSLGVVLASVFIWYKPEWHLADPVCTFLFSIIVLGSTYSLAREVIFILMEAAPQDLHATELAQELAAIKGVFEIHDLHVWCISARESVAITHLVVDWALVSDSPSLYSEILAKGEAIMCKYKIHHVTIQIEPNFYRGSHCLSDCCINTRKIAERPSSSHCT